MLDIYTERGQRTLADELLAVAIFERRNPGMQYVHTDKESDARVDAVIVDKSTRTIRSAVLMSCRYNLGVHDFRSMFGSEWLLTAQKIDDGAAVAAALRAKLVGMLYLCDEGALLCQTIADADGQTCVPIRTAVTRTQRTVNGGTIERLNAFIDMSNCVTYE
jgi:hypothetical protein